MIDGNKLGDVGFEKIGTPYSEMDCQAFVEWCFRKCGYDKNLAGSNAWFRYGMNHGAIMTPEDCVRQLGCVPKGAVLFIHAFDGGEPEKYKNDGLGNASHMGIGTLPRGKGAIASSKSRGGVQESEFKGRSIKGGWNMVWLPDFVAYDYGSNGNDPIVPEDPAPSYPEIETATVTADRGKDVNLRTAPSTGSALVDRVPLGEMVTVLEYGEDWCKVKWKWKTGYMMTKFLLFDDDLPFDDDDYTIIISGLSRDEALMLKEQYPNAEVSVG